MNSSKQIKLDLPKTKDVSFGKFWALASAIIITIVGLCFIIYGIYIISRQSTRSEIVGSVLRINGDINQKCESTSVSKAEFTCTITVSYIYRGKKYTPDIFYSGDRKYYVGQIIKLYMNKKNFNDVVMQEQISRWPGFLMIIISLAIITGFWFWYWATTKWDLADDKTIASLITGFKPF